MCNCWTDEEIAVVVESYLTASPEELLRLLPKRNWGMIHAKAVAMGLKKDMKPWGKHSNYYKAYLPKPKSYQS